MATSKNARIVVWLIGLPTAAVIGAILSGYTSVWPNPASGVVVVALLIVASIASLRAGWFGHMLGWVLVGRLGAGSRWQIAGFSAIHVGLYHAFSRSAAPGALMYGTVVSGVLYLRTVALASGFSLRGRRRLRRRLPGNYRRGDVVWAYVPFEDEIDGKDRPVVIWGYRRDQYCVFYCTSKEKGSYSHIHVPDPPWGDGRDSWVEKTKFRWITGYSIRKRASQVDDRLLDELYQIHGQS